MTRLVVVVMLVLGAIALWLFNDAPDQQSTDSPTAAAIATTSPTPVPPPTSATPAQPGDPLDRATALDAARAVLTAWARPDQPYDRWWAALQPLLTEDAQESFSFTDPATIPSLTITGPATESENAGDPYVATFYFPTDGGRFGVDIARSPDGGPWRAFSIIFPGGESQRQ